jgi:plasmid stability protein
MDSRLFMEIPSSLHDALRKLALANERSASAEARVAIAAHVASEERRREQAAER